MTSVVIWLTLELKMLGVGHSMTKMASSDQQLSVCCLGMHVKICFTMNPTGPKELKYVTGSSVVVIASAASDSQSTGDLFNVISFNLHGLNNSRSYLIDLRSNPDVFNIAVQER
jgi:hypothetical protein